MKRRLFRRQSVKRGLACARDLPYPDFRIRGSRAGVWSVCVHVCFINREYPRARGGGRVNVRYLIRRVYVRRGRQHSHERRNARSRSRARFSSCVSPHLKSLASAHKTRYHTATRSRHVLYPLNLLAPLSGPAYLMHLETKVRIHNSLLTLIGLCAGHVKSIRKSEESRY